MAKIYDERFVRMWEFYLAASEMAFREQDMMVFQMQLTKRQGVVPITRDYIAREEARLRGARERQPAAAAPRRRIDALAGERVVSGIARGHKSVKLQLRDSMRKFESPV